MHQFQGGTTMRHTFRKRLSNLLVVSLLLVATLTACGQPSEAQTASITATEATTASTSTLSTAAPTASATATSVADTVAEQCETHDDATDYDWESADVIPIELNGESITAEGAGVIVDGSTATLTSAGTYSLRGTLTDGQIVVDTSDEDAVRLILNGVDISNSTNAPIYIMRAEKALIVLADDTENVVSDSDSYGFPSADVNEPNAAIFSAADLTITGNGSLTVTGNYNDGIASKDGLIIDSGTITVRAVDDGIRGKDYLVVQDGSVTVAAGGDGLKADNTEDATRGYITIESGMITVTAAGDAIAAETNVHVADGAITLTSGGGSEAQISADASAKGIKGTTSVFIDGGTLTIDSADDAIHANGSIMINGGSFVLASGDDAMHADAALEINGGDIQITQSYEGLESAVITINAGDINLVASDDGVNIAGGNDGSGMMPGPGRGGRPGQGSDQETFTYTGDYYLYINGGTLIVDAAGDGLDANGAIEMTGGVVLVNGPTENMNGAMDYDGGFNMAGGLLVAAGSAGMSQAPGAYSSQSSVLINYNAVQPAGTIVHIQNSAGESILTFAPTKSYQSIALSSPELASGETYTIYTGGSATGTATNGWYQDGGYTPGAEYTQFTVSAVVTTIGNTGRFR
jgi:hypothetical protein